jgi:tetratricopeptide (TPR) repeat protein
MKKILSALLLLAFFAAEAQVQTPQPSPAASVSTVVGLTDVKIDYSRPRTKGRKIFGEGQDALVPYGKLWRTGANNGTKITFSDDVTVEGTKVAKGEYLIFSWPTASEWTISLYKDVKIGGNTDDYKAENEVAKFKVKSGKIAERVDMFTVNISDVSDDSKTAKIEILWENTVAKFTIGVDYDAKVMKSIETSTKVAPGNYANAAVYYAENGKDLNQALVWINEAIKANPKAFWYIHQKAKIQAKAGDVKGARETANESIKLAKENGNDFGYVKLNEDFLKTLK